MSDQPNPFVNAVLVAVIVLGGLLPAGYYGFMLLNNRQASGEPASQTVFVELKTQTIAEIRAVKSETIAEIQKVGAEITAGVERAAKAPVKQLVELKRAVETLHAEQKGIVERLAKMDRQPMRTAAATPMAPTPSSAQPPMPGPLAQTIYFPLGVAKGAKIDAQLSTVLPGLMKRAAKQENCRADVAGFADTLGNDQKNLALSQTRADYVAMKLKAGGLAIGSVRSWGERWLNVHTLDAIKNEKNRRVVIELSCGTPVA